MNALFLLVEVGDRKCSLIRANPTRLVVTRKELDAVLTWQESKAGIVSMGRRAGTAAVASESLMLTLSRTLVTVVPPTRSLISPTKSISVCSAPPRLARASSRPGIFTTIGTKYSALLSWR